MLIHIAGRYIYIVIIRRQAGGYVICFYAVVGENIVWFTDTTNTRLFRNYVLYYCLSVIFVDYDCYQHANKAYSMFVKTWFYFAAIH